MEPLGCLLSFILWFLLTVDGLYCPRGMTSSNADAYPCLIMSTTRSSWSDAIHACEQHGGSLAKILTQAQKLYLNDYIVFKNINDNVWIGANDISREGQYVWPDRSPVIWTDWDANQPNGTGSENCVATSVHLLHWHDQSCKNTFFYVCEINLASKPASTISIAKGVRLASGEASVFAATSWMNYALTARLTAEDESLCVLYCLYEAECVRVAYRPAAATMNCLLYQLSPGSVSSLWKWRVYDLPKKFQVTASSPIESNLG